MGMRDRVGGGLRKIEWRREGILGMMGVFRDFDYGV